MALPNNINIVILASNYNPSIVSKQWLYDRKIFTEAVDNFVHTPLLALIENQNLGLTVDEQRLQVVIKRITPDNIANSNAIVRKFVDILPETPYKAVGFNYRYILREKGCDLRTLLIPKPTKLKAIFSVDYQLGTMIGFSFENFVATFTVMPSLGGGQTTRISFNFHADVADINEVRLRIASQMKTFHKAESIMTELCTDV